MVGNPARQTLSQELGATSGSQLDEVDASQISGDALFAEPGDNSAMDASFSNGSRHLIFPGTTRRLAMSRYTMRKLTKTFGFHFSKTIQRGYRQRSTILPRLWVERLEDRLAPATVSWINPAGGDWDKASNWSTGQLPGSSDDVVINLPGITVTHAAAISDSIHSLTSNDAISISAGSLTLAASSKITSTLTLSGGTLLSPAWVKPLSQLDVRII
jgi:hypothetical protein